MFYCDKTSFLLGSMQRKIVLPCLLAMLVLLTLVAQTFGQSVRYGTIQITGVNAPASVGVSQPVTISITVSYEFMQPMMSEFVAIALSPHTETGNPYPILGSTGCYPSSQSGIPSSESVCLAETTEGFFTPGIVTVSFTLTAPSTPETWRPVALASIAVTNAEAYLAAEDTTFQVVIITVT
jgi:hypothetical protein